LGLISGITGSIILFFFGMPPPIFKAGQYVLDEPNDREKKIILFYRMMSWLGLLLVIVAFSLQFFAS
jgi:hypothetical protein